MVLEHSYCCGYQNSGYHHVKAKCIINLLLLLLILLLFIIYVLLIFHKFKVFVIFNILTDSYIYTFRQPFSVVIGDVLFTGTRHSIMVLSDSHCFSHRLWWISLIWLLVSHHNFQLVTCLISEKYKIIWRILFLFKSKIQNKSWYVMSVMS